MMVQVGLLQVTLLDCNETEKWYGFDIGITHRDQELINNGMAL